MARFEAKPYSVLGVAAKMGQICPTPYARLFHKRFIKQKYGRNNGSAHFLRMGQIINFVEHYRDRLKRDKLLTPIANGGESLEDDLVRALQTEEEKWTRQMEEAEQQLATVRKAMELLGRKATAKGKQRSAAARAKMSRAARLRWKKIKAEKKAAQK